MPQLTEPNQVGKREDLADIVANVDVKETPFTSRVNKSSKPTNSRFDWQLDKYASARVAGTVDGVDVGEFENAAEDRERIGNYIQYFRRAAKVSTLAEDLSNVAGVRSELAKATAKKIVELKRDIEATFLGGNDGQADNGSVPYLTIGLDKWIDTTGPTIPYAMPTAYRPDATGQIITTADTSLAESDIQTMMRVIFEETGMQGDYWMICGAKVRRAFTDFTRTRETASGTDQYTNQKVRSFNVDGNSKKVVNTTGIFEGDFGTVTIAASNFIGGATYDDDRAYLLDMDKIHVRSLKKPFARPLPDLGGGPRVLIEAVCGLQVDNPLGLGKIKPA
jgi:hypothetical protein